VVIDKATAVAGCSVFEHGVEGMQQLTHDGTDGLKLLGSTFFDEQ